VKVICSSYRTNMTAASRWHTGEFTLQPSYSR